MIWPAMGADGSDLSRRALEGLALPISKAWDAGALFTGIDKGQQADIALAAWLEADFLLMDDRKGVRAARSRGLRVTGTLGILELAAQGELVDFTRAVERPRKTSFRIPEALLDALLKKHGGNV